MALAGSRRALYENAEAFLQPVQNLFLLIVIFEREEKLAIVGAVNEARAILESQRYIGALIRDQRTDERRQFVPGQNGLRCFLGVIYPEMAGALPHENYRGVKNSRYWRCRGLRDGAVLVKVSLLNGRRAQQSRHGRGDGAHLIVIPYIGRRLAAVYFCDVLQELILVGIIEISQAFQIELRRA